MKLHIHFSYSYLVDTVLRVVYMYSLLLHSVVPYIRLYMSCTCTCTFCRKIQTVSIYMYKSMIHVSKLPGYSGTPNNFQDQLVKHSRRQYRVHMYNVQQQQCVHILCKIPLGSYTYLYEHDFNQNCTTCIYLFMYQYVTCINMCINV